MTNNSYLDQFGKSIYINLDKAPNDHNIGKVDNTDKSEASTVIQKLKNVLLNNLIKDYIYDLLKRKYIDSGNIDLLLPLFENYFIGGEKEWIDFTKGSYFILDYTKESENICLDQIYQFYSRFFKPEFFDKMINLELYGKPSVGKGEAFLALFTQITNTQYYEKGGDLRDGDTKLEVKAKDGRLGGQRTRHNGVEALQLLEDAFPNINLLSNNKTFNKRVCQRLGEYINLNWESTFTKRKSLNKLCYAISNYELPWSDEFHKPLTDAITTNSVSDFVNAIHYWGYRNDEDFDYLLLINTNKKKMISFSSERNFNESYQFFKDHIHGTIGWADNAADRSGASITYKG